MKTQFLIRSLIACTIVAFTLTGCEDGFKSSANDNTARPTIPDEHGRNVGDDEIYDNASRNQSRVKENPDSTEIENDHTATGHDQH